MTVKCNKWTRIFFCYEADYWDNWWNVWGLQIREQHYINVCFLILILTAVMKDNVFVFSKHTWMYLGIKGHHVSNLNTAQMVQKKNMYKQRKEIIKQVLYNLGIWVKDEWEFFVLFLQFFYNLKLFWYKHLKGKK